MTGAGNTIGGLTATPGTAAGDVISGNTGNGVEITGKTGNVVAGNLIGTDVTGTVALGNLAHGVLIETGASGNLIGGSTAGARNIVSANSDSGVMIYDANNNLVEGNYIGTDKTGKMGLGNNLVSSGSYGGVTIDDGSSGNTIGGLTATPGTDVGNVISGNITAGVLVNGAGSNNLIAGNLIGTDATGTVALGNPSPTPEYGGTGVGVSYSGATTVGEPGGRNVISDNGVGNDSGTNVYMAYSSGSVIQSNYIGTDITGTVALSNETYYGVFLTDGSYTVGGLTPTPGTGLGNVISGNEQGVNDSYYIAGSSTVIEGNIIGADATGLHELPNAIVGVGLGTDFVTIGGTVAGSANLISGDNRSGSSNIDLRGSSDNTIEGNLIGTDITGEAPLPLLPGDVEGYGVIIIDGANGNTVGGTSAAARNIISGIDGPGVFIGALFLPDSVTSDNVIEGNFIGTDALGTTALANSGDGVEIATGSFDNTIGGTVAGASNVISGNTVNGVEITGTGYGAYDATGRASGNIVVGNDIGTNAAGTAAIANGNAGVEIDSSVSGNTIGGTAAGGGNVISGNTGNGVVIDGTGLPAGTLLYLKADDNTNNSGSDGGLGVTLEGGVTYGTGVTGQAFQFNDTAGERVVVSDPQDYLAADAVTLSAWINLNSLPGATPYVIASRAYSATSENYGLYVNSSGELIFEWYSSGAFHTETSSGADLGSRLDVFQQVAVVSDGSTVTFYVNGVAVSSSAMPVPLDNSASGSLEIGGLSQGPNLFNGLIDEFSVTNGPLPADEIARIYANAGDGDRSRR